jgi:uncharacterized protein YhaN
LSKLNRPADETPAGLERAIELIEEAHRERERLVDLDRRITGMRGNIATFESKVAALISALAPDLNGQPGETATRELRRRLDANRKIEARRDQLLSQHKQAMLRNVQAEVKQRHTVAERESLREEIGGGSDEQIISRIAQDQMAWVLTSYMTPLTGWLAGRFGIKYVFLISVAGFTLA